ncbi:helix-turn-helix domain-containing protein [Lactiplantibacillus pentosus]|uniref:helix-turn-helix domain-containing protein n=1 Tax=Lactiplantibacillus pentosus TaxID=1589 RepID=UPI001C1F2D5F|nr:XRE family transcriptional regulator [Lactiplantibacillus pentosus]MBU7466083.1 LexA family transcriptional regulator [Lactiplantibacillus pentosus]MBU7489637.1 LexA family transcriptional regulator [Lactiplantibacillus pentosus]MDT6967935.1 XRE family transcriptional regulator [Lactiplantibacillus pentosus]MDT6968093.1 XRE family transcriptional regulator [Lactiplantibacillus pentosus]MDT6968198.1 XRE family transcriptional regulator [Lactiplantibacillus pentosus]
MNVGDRMKSIRKQQGISADQLAESIGVSRSTIFRYEKGDIEKMPIEVVANVASSLHVSLVDLMGISNDSISEKITEIVSKLNPDRQQNVYNYADNQLKEQNGKVVNLPLVGKSAANPTELTYGDVEIEHDDFTDVPHGADTAIRIQGDSMEPLIHDGQIIFYHRQEEVENGEIAIVEIDGDGVTCKQIYYDYTSDEVILRSINKKYEPRHVKDDQVRIIGRVIL